MRYPIARFAAACVAISFLAARLPAAQPSTSPSDVPESTSPHTTAKPTTGPSPFTRPAAKPIDRPVAAVKRVLVVSMDGLRPDLMLLADAPNLRGLMKRGSYTMWARTTPNSITLPSHISMMTGVTPRRHEIEWNRDLDLSVPIFPRVPTLFEAAKRHGYTTAVAAGKDKFDMFDRPGVLDWNWIPEKGKVETAAVMKAALPMIREHKPDVMLLHLPSVDNAGHLKGWASPEQMKAIEDADAAVGKVVALLDELKLSDSTLLIVTADHGGAGKNHGPDDPRSRHIPWIAVGPGRPQEPRPDELSQAHRQHRRHLRHRLLVHGHPPDRLRPRRRAGQADPGNQGRRTAPPQYAKSAGGVVRGYFTASGSRAAAPPVHGPETTSNRTPRQTVNSVGSMKPKDPMRNGHPKAAAAIFLAACVVLLMTSVPARGDAKLPAVLSSHMVLQRDLPVPVWGTAAPGEKVTVTFRGREKSAAADARGNWRVTLDPLKAGGPDVLTVTAANTLTLDDVLVGEVWLGSGQSNMAGRVGNYAKNDPVLAKDLAAAPYPKLRLMPAGAKGWQVADAKSVESFSAILFAFGLRLHQELDVPVGLVTGSAGGTPSGFWLSEEAYASDPACKEVVAAFAKTFDYDAAQKQYPDKLIKWEAATAHAKEIGRSAGPKPQPPLRAGECSGKVGHLYEQFIRPFVGYAVRGVLWDQGESGTAIQGVDQYTLMGALIRGWRKDWADAGPPAISRGSMFRSPAAAAARGTPPTR